MRPYKLSFIAAMVLVPLCAFAYSPEPSPAATVSKSADSAASVPTLFIEAPDNFQSALTAAMIKKSVPATVVTSQSGSMYTLKSADVFAKPESTGSKFARCMFAYCAGIEGTASVSVQLVRNADGAVVWAYQVRKGNAGPVGIQSLSEAIAKHLRNDYLEKQK